MDDGFKARTSRNLEESSMQGLDDLSVNLESDEESVEGSVGGEQFRNVWEGIDGIAMNNKQDILALNLQIMGPKEISYCHFSSLEIAYLFYNWYGRVNGFSARKGKILRNNKGEALQQTFLCHKQGFREDKGLTIENRKREQRPETRCGCMARFRVHVDTNSERWYVTCFDDDHNHTRSKRYTVGCWLHIGK